MSDLKRSERFILGLARLIADTGVDLTATSCDVQLNDRTTGRYIGVIEVDEESIKFKISPYDDTPEIEVEIKEETNET